MGIFSKTIESIAFQCDVEDIRHHLESGGDVNERRHFNTTLLMEAVISNNIAALELLLDHGADMELVNMGRLTALHYAIIRKRTRAATILAKRGACANKGALFGFMTRTPLQSAIKNGMLEVTTELLAHGADPMAPNNSGHIPETFIQPKPNREAFVKLLEVYTNVDIAIKMEDIRAISVHCKKSLSGDAVANMSAIDAAIEAKHKAAVSVILRVTLRNEDEKLRSKDLEDMIAAYTSVQHGIEDTKDFQWRTSLTRKKEDYESDVLENVLQWEDLERLKQLVEGMPLDWIKTSKLTNGWTALDKASTLQCCKLVQYLIVGCGLNPQGVSDDGKAPLDRAEKIDSNSDVYKLLLHHKKKQVFSSHTTTLMKTEALTMQELVKLVGQITSVYDLRSILSLGIRVLSPAEIHTVLIKSFDEIIREKLVFEDKDFVFFELGLKQCKDLNYVSEAEYIEWRQKARKANMESATWVQAIKQSLQELTCKVSSVENNITTLVTHFDDLKQFIIKKEAYELEQRRRDRIISLVSNALIACGGPLIQDIFKTVFEVWEPAILLGTLANMDIADFLAEKTSEFIFKDGIEAVLIDSSVDPGEFALVLRNAVNLEKAVVPAEVKVLPLSVPPSVTHSVALLPSVKKTSRFKNIVRAAVLHTKAQLDEESNQTVPEAMSAETMSPSQCPKSTPSPAVDLQISEADLEENPYHYAVRHTCGDLRGFEELVQYIEDDDGDINATLPLHINSNEFANSPEGLETAQGSAMVYASYMGYIDIVEWFLKRQDVDRYLSKIVTAMKSALVALYFK
ncbi:hypothetical protein BBO99_00000185 [Phytophthora kernoviae]|uniref:Uncharacterized protein n=1 Tax=Phytophthora kernoviae TaxID=325452 RepID=A0A3R7JZJ9_9STRA|nr:hypothetical protein BBI17_000287 [Phytophthora kernoviae]RLN85844.1 hypothetical protein BBO99_00000185 [Phytophthora kernoviae]